MDIKNLEASLVKAEEYLIIVRKIENRESTNAE